MSTVIENPVCKVFNRWRQAIEPVVGEGHYSMDSSITYAKTPYARLILLSSSGNMWDLDNNEISQSISIQSESFASGPNATSKAYALDDVTRKVMADMGFRMTFSEIVSNVETDIKRIVSRFTRTYTGYLPDGE